MHHFLASLSWANQHSVCWLSIQCWCQSQGHTWPGRRGRFSLTLCWHCCHDFHIQLHIQL